MTQSILDQLPHDLRKDVEDLAKTVWKDHGNETVHILDGWWHRIDLRWSPTSPPPRVPNGVANPAPGCLFLNLIEGELDRPVMYCTFTVDFMRNRVKLRYMDPAQYRAIPPSCSDVIPRVIEWTRENEGSL